MQTDFITLSLLLNFTNFNVYLKAASPPTLLPYRPTPAKFVGFVQDIKRQDFLYLVN